MSVSHTKIATLRLIYTALCTACLLLLSACSRYVDVNPSARESEMMDSVMIFLGRADESKLTGAFLALDSSSYKLTVTTHRLDGAGNITESSTDIHDAGSFVPYTLSENRGYNNARHETKYMYRFLPDTVIGEKTLRVADIRVRMEAAAEVPVQKIRFFIDIETMEVIALRLRRRSESLLYREESLIYMEGRNSGTGQIIPVRFDFETTVKAFFSDPIRLSTSAVFEATALRDAGS